MCLISSSKRKERTQQVRCTTDVLFELINSAGEEEEKK
jgi:hypothetical protein